MDVNVHTALVRWLASLRDRKRDNTGDAGESAGEPGHKPKWIVVGGAAISVDNEGRIEHVIVGNP